MTKRRTHPLGRTGISCYGRHNKQPHRYSPQYHAWRDAMAAGRGVPHAAAMHDRTVLHTKSEQWNRRAAQ